MCNACAAWVWTALTCKPPNSLLLAMVVLAATGRTANPQEAAAHARDHVLATMAVLTEQGEVT